MGKPLRVLIIEDSANDAELLLEELRSGGYDPTFERVSTDEAMKAALDLQVWDIVFADYTMPQFNGMTALKLLRGMNLDIPYIFVSGTIGEDMAVESMRNGANDYIMKGNLKRLVPAVERELREAEVRRKRRLAERTLEEHERALSTLMSNLPGMVYRCRNDTDWTMEFVSEGGYELTGYRPSDLTERRVSYGLEVIHPEDQKAVWADVQSALQDRRPFKLTYRIIAADGKEKWVWEQGCGIFSPQGDLLALEGFITDITERKKAEEMVKHMAYFDGLTSLPSRNWIYDYMLNATRADRKKGRPMALLLMDLDRFKEVNDTLGHHRGDLVLEQVGRRLKSVLFEPDVVARMGGDEFAIFLPRLAATEDVHKVAAKIQAALDQPIMVERIPIVLNASIGVALYPEHGMDPQLLLQRADVAMYTAKRTGDACVIYDPSRDKHSPRRLALMGELRQAIEEKQLFLQYQPKIDLSAERVIGVEALARWKHPDFGLIPPDQFIPTAEQSGLIRTLTAWILTKAQGQCLTWSGEGMNLTMAVNLSVRNLYDPNLPEHLTGLLASCGGRTDHLELEITEGAIMQDPARALQAIVRLKQMGIRFAIDDFGTGYSSLSYLKRLPVDTIKIDKSFTLHMIENENDAVIVRSTIELGHNLGLRVVAEGVENQETYDRLRSLGCDAAQGYYMSKPLTAEVLTRWLGESPWGLSPNEGGSG